MNVSGKNLCQYFRLIFINVHCECLKQGINKLDDNLRAQATKLVEMNKTDSSDENTMQSELKLYLFDTSHNSQLLVTMTFTKRRGKGSSCFSQPLNYIFALENNEFT